MKTKDKILNVAEKLFAIQGFHGTSLRELTAEAKVNLAAVNYHFGSKEDLLDAVITRRLLPLNKTREQKLHHVLAEAKKQGSPPKTHDIIAALVEPTVFFLFTEKGAASFALLITRIQADSDSTGKAIFFKYIMPLMYQFLNALYLALPHLPRQTLFYRFHFGVGSMSHLLKLSTGHFPLPEDIPTITDPQELAGMMISFFVHGMEAP